MLGSATVRREGERVTYDRYTGPLVAKQIWIDNAWFKAYLDEYERVVKRNSPYRARCLNPQCYDRHRHPGACCDIPF